MGYDSASRARYRTPFKPNPKHMNTTKTQDSETNQASPMVQTPPLTIILEQKREEVRKIEQLLELREAARPLFEYLKANHHPHIKVIVDGDSVEVLEGLRRVQF